MEKEINLEISRIRVEIEHLKENRVTMAGNDLVIFTIPDEIIDLLSDLDLPTIHMVLEVILFYSSYTGRSSEIEDIMYAYLEQYVDSEALYKAVRLVIDYDLVNKLEAALGQIYDTIHAIVFCGWTIKTGSINFYNNYDILIRSEKI